jgi:hypothetical protein
MTQLTPTQPGHTRCDSALNDILHYNTSGAARTRGASEHTIGTLEHAELVAAVRREFPEIYGLKAERYKAG